MRAVTARFEPDRGHPFIDHSRILAGRQMRPVEEATWKEAGTTEHLGTTYPIPNGFTRVLRDLELHLSFRLALNNRDAVAHSVSDNEIGNLQADKIAAAKLAVDCKIEQSQIPEIAREFEPGADGPNLLWQQRPFLTNQPSLVPGYALRFDSRELDFGYEFSSIRPSHS